MRPLGIPLHGAKLRFLAYARAGRPGLYSWQGMGTVLGALSHTQTELLQDRAGREGGYFDRVLPAMMVNRRTIKSCSSASTGNC